MDLMFEAFNLFNKLNYQSVNNTVGAAFAGPFSVTGRDEQETDRSAGIYFGVRGEALAVGVSVYVLSAERA